MGGTDDPSNLIELTPEEHAEAHRLLYEEHGNWQDYVAWQGLAKLAEKKDYIKLMLQEAGKKGLSRRSSTNKGKKYNISASKTFDHKGEKNPCARTYRITHPDGTEETVKSLKTWCADKGLNYNSMHKACISKGNAFNGYRVVKA